MATPISYHLERGPGAGLDDELPCFTAASDANAVTVAQQVATILGIPLFVIRTDNNTILNGGAALTPAAQGAALGNSVTGVLYSPY